MSTRRALRRAVPLGALALLAWGVAPALSLSPYVPEPVSFEQPLPAAKRVVSRSGADRADADHGAHDHGRGEHRSHRGPVRFLTPPVEASGRFDLVGVAGELSSLEFRVRDGDGEWSEWVATSNGDPVYTGGSDAVQVRSRGVRPAGRLHFVNVSGDHDLASRLVNTARKAVSSAIVAASVPIAGAEPPDLEMVSREDWGATRKSGGCKPRTAPSYGSVAAAAVHHTVTTTEYAEGEAAGMVLGICRYHRNANGWNDIGYNALIDRFGRLYEGREGGLDRAVVGAHAQGFNATTTGVASLGTHTRQRPTREAIRSFVRYLAWKLAVHGKPARGRTRIVSGGGSLNRHPAGRRPRIPRIYSHNKVGFTRCAGSKMRRQLKKIRKRAQRKIDRFGEGLPPAPVPPATDGEPTADGEPNPA